MLFIGVLATGCAALSPLPPLPSPPEVPEKVLLNTVPFYAQKKYQCGPASLAMALQWAGVGTFPDALVPMVFTPGRKGSLQSGLITAARRHGRLAYPFNGMTCLLHEVAAGRPVIVLQNLGLKSFPQWHYAVVVGYDLNERVVVLHSGDRAVRQVGFRTFAHTWRRAEDWGLLVLPVAQMPVCAEGPPYLQAALGLQTAGHIPAARIAFENAVQRWPENADANIALGNAAYLDDDQPKAIEAFTRAVQIEPGNADALNNLAHLLAATGDFEKAEAMAEKAVSIGGPHLDIYRQTLEQIRDRRP